MAKDLDAAGAELRMAFDAVRARTEGFAAPLSAEDMAAQTMADVSPTKWHLAHTTWFWETFLLKPSAGGYAEFDPRFNYLFNSYYETIGDRHARPSRGQLTRPGVEHVLAYRAHVDGAMRQWLDQASPSEIAETAPIMRVGLAHEEQHQELLLTDIKHVLAMNPFPEAAYALPDKPCPDDPAAPDQDWVRFEAELCEIGAAGDGFHFDHEGPRHRIWIEAFELAAHPVTNRDFLAFIEDGGYRTPSLWLSEGWDAIQCAGRRAPVYWRERDGEWREHTLHGEQPLDLDAPVSHIDFYEAIAFAEWTGYRLPWEFEWERAAVEAAEAGAIETAGWAEPGGFLHPCASRRQGRAAGLFGDVWEWTRSDYAPYPGYRAPDGAIGEYNGKFMCGQYVLRGGSRLTPPDHMRTTYRNFFPPDAQWQMTGLRLARDV